MLCVGGGAGGVEVVGCRLFEACLEEVGGECSCDCHEAVVAVGIGGEVERVAEFGVGYELDGQEVVGVGLCGVVGEQDIGFDGGGGGELRGCDSCAADGAYDVAACCDGGVGAALAVVVEDLRDGECVCGADVGLRVGFGRGRVAVVKGIVASESEYGCEEEGKEAAYGAVQTLHVGDGEEGLCFSFRRRVFGRSGCSLCWRGPTCLLGWVR